MNDVAGYPLYIDEESENRAIRSYFADHFEDIRKSIKMYNIPAKNYIGKDFAKLLGEEKLSKLTSQKACDLLGLFCEKVLSSQKNKLLISGLSRNNTLFSFSLDLVSGETDFFSGKSYEFGTVAGDIFAELSIGKEIESLVNSLDADFCSEVSRFFIGFEVKVGGN